MSLRSSGSRPDLMVELQQCYDNANHLDAEEVVAEADVILCNALLRFGCADMVSLYRRTRKKHA